MGEPINAERIRQHYATVVSPSLALSPFGKRTVVGTPAVSFENSIGVAQRTFGNSANLFTLSATAINFLTGTIFRPSEGLIRNPAESSPSVAHGHIGAIFPLGGGPLPAAVNTGVSPDADQACTAELALLIEAIAEKAAAEFKNDPIEFLKGFELARQDAYAETMKSAASGFKDALVSVFEFALKYNPPAIITRSAIATAQYVASGRAEQDYQAMEEYLRSGRMAEDLVKGGEALKGLPEQISRFYENLDPERLKQIFKEWLHGEIARLGCSARDFLSEMLSDRKLMAAQLGEMAGTAAAVATLVVAGAVAEIAVTKGGLTAATRAGRAIGAVGSRVGGLYDKLADEIADAWRKTNNRTTPSRTPDSRSPQQTSEGTPEAQGGQKKKKSEDENENGSVTGQDNDGRPLSPCKSCP